MSHQIAVTIVADVRSGEADSLDRLLRSMGDGVANGSVVDLAAFPDLHFARFVLLEEARDLRDRPLPALLIYMCDVDVSRDRHLGELVAMASDGLDQLYEHCEGYPEPERRTRETRLAYLRAHVVKEQARYFNTTGRNVRQVRQEAELRDRIEELLDGPPDGTERDPAAVRKAVRELVAHDESLRWARAPAPGLGFTFRAKEALHLVTGVLLVLLLSPLLLLIAPFFLVLLRLHERADRAPHLPAELGRVEELADLEDLVAHNPFTAVGFVKPGLFRRLTIQVIFVALNFAARHLFNHGNLAGVKTIHSARWVALNERRRVIFASNYDGSRESYMDDFVDKIAWGLNAAFGSGHGFPNTNWLLLDGAKDEQAFKDFLRRHLVATRVWHSAYDRLTNANIENNARIRSGLQDDAEPDEVRQWVQAL
jgi:hypothetical protein